MWLRPSQIQLDSYSGKQDKGGSNQSSSLPMLFRNFSDPSPFVVQGALVSCVWGVLQPPKLVHCEGCRCSAFDLDGKFACLRSGT